MVEVVAGLEGKYVRQSVLVAVVCLALTATIVLVTDSGFGVELGLGAVGDILAVD